jgi:hypothetical protein
MSKIDEWTFDDFLNATKYAMKRFKLLQKLQIGSLVLCYSAILVTILVKIMGGQSKYVYVFGLIGMIGGLGSVVLGKKVEQLAEKMSQFKAVAERLYTEKISKEQIAAKLRENKAIAEHSYAEKISDADLNKIPSVPTIPLSIGFVNLSGEDLSGIVSEDENLLSPLFLESRKGVNGQIPKAQILFVYAHLNEDGSILGLPPSGIRQIVQLTDAAIVVLASPNDASSIQNAIALPGPKTANIVFTINRNGNNFSRFFCELFMNMRNGNEMLSAWVKLAPQNPNGNLSNAPATILLAEGGKIAFPA